MAGDYLREEGFTDVKIMPPAPLAFLRGEADISSAYSQWIVANVDAGSKMVALAGLHTGCIELWAKPGINSINDLKGRTIAVTSTDVTDVIYGFWSAMLASVGLDARTDVNFITAGSQTSTLEVFLQGKSDALMAATFQVPLLRADPRNQGRLLMSNLEDKPWSQYYCCQLIASRDWAQKYPMAARRATRAILRANDLVARDPAAAVLSAVSQNLLGTTTYDTALAVLKNCRFEWRDIDAEESLRFYSLRLAETKQVKGVPQQLVAQIASYAFIGELKKQYPRAVN
jgi:NitT/TauT family transport system substrate-binding protein